MTREPRVRLSEAFSAISRQQTTSKNEVASSHSWVWRFCQRRLTARPKVVVAWPVLVNRRSGSRVMFPTRVTTFPLMPRLLRQPRRQQRPGGQPPSRAGG